MSAKITVAILDEGYLVYDNRDEDLPSAHSRYAVDLEAAVGEVRSLVRKYEKDFEEHEKSKAEIESLIQRMQASVERAVCGGEVQ